MPRLLAAALMLAASALAAAAQDNPIVARMAAFAEAYNAGDGAAMAAFYTEDGAVLPPGGLALVGRAAIATHYQAAFDAGVANLRYEIVEIRGHGPASAVEIGETLVDAGGRTIRGRYLHVWVNTGETWALSRDIYHVLAAE
jgi:uncharacterized protein (TIGR02246 family)